MIGDRELFERLSSPRPAPIVALKSNWLVQQQPIRNEVVNNTSKEVAKWERPIRDTRRNERRHWSGNSLWKQLANRFESGR